MPPLIQGLMRPEAYEHPIAAFQLLETHISWVILTGEYAYKLKKPVNLGFVDFSTLRLREHFCQEEVRLNRRLAPELYLGVVPVLGTTEHPRFHGSGETVEFAVKMRQFDQERLLPSVLQRGELRSDQLDQLALTLALFHDQAAIADRDSPWGTPAAVRHPVQANFQTLAAERICQPEIAAIKDWCNAEFLRLQSWFQQRHDSGRIRECHGDLHLGNLVLLNDTVQPFDGLEFNEELRWIDVISEIAFLVMDLQQRGRPDLGQRVLNGWLEHSGDYDGLAGWRWYIVYRALVRAKVAALRAGQADVSPKEQAHKRQEAADYVALALRTIERRSTPVIIMHGLSGSGKSRAAQTIAERFGAVVLRSDAERKRMFGQWGVAAKFPQQGNMYAADVTRTVYEQVLGGLVPQVIEAGFPVVVDAACLKRAQREFFRNVADSLRATFVIVDVQAGVETMKQRLHARNQFGRDPSDADQSVLDLQIVDREVLSDEELAQAVVTNTEDSAWADKLEKALNQRAFFA